MRCILFCAPLEILALFACLCIELRMDQLHCGKWVVGDIRCWLVWNHIRCSVEDEDSQCCVCLWLVDDVDASCDSRHWSLIQTHWDVEPERYMTPAKRNYPAIFHFMATVCRLNCIMWHCFIYLENIITKSI